MGIFTTFLLLSTAVWAQYVQLPRYRSAVESILGTADTTGFGNPRPLNIVWVYMRPAEAADSHDFESQMNLWNSLFSTLRNVTFTPALNWPTAPQWAGADLVIFNARAPSGGMQSSHYTDFNNHLDLGKGLAFIHTGLTFSVNNPAVFSAYAGLCWSAAIPSTDRRGEIALNLRTHTLTTRFPNPVRVYDEAYFRLQGDTTQMQIAAHSVETIPNTTTLVNAPHLLTKTVRAGRVFSSALGHYTEFFDDPYFRIFLLRGFSWAAGENFHRLRDLVYPGANVINDVTGIRLGKNRGTSLKILKATAPLRIGNVYFQLNGRRSKP